MFFHLDIGHLRCSGDREAPYDPNYIHSFFYKYKDLVVLTLDIAYHNYTPNIAVLFLVPVLPSHFSTQILFLIHTNDVNFSFIHPFTLEIPSNVMHLMLERAEMTLLSCPILCHMNKNTLKKTYVAFSYIHSILPFHAYPIFFLFIMTQKWTVLFLSSCHCMFQVMAR